MPESVKYSHKMLSSEKAILRQIESWRQESRDIRIASKHFSCFGHRQRRGQNKAVSSPGSKDSCSWVCRWHRGWLAAEVVGVGPGCPIRQPRTKKRGNMIFIRSKKLRVTYKFSLSERQQVRMAGGHLTLSLKIPTNQRSKEPTSAEAYLRFVPWSWASKQRHRHLGGSNGRRLNVDTSRWSRKNPGLFSRFRNENLRRRRRPETGHRFDWDGGSRVRSRSCQADGRDRCDRKSRDSGWGRDVDARKGLTRERGDGERSAVGRLNRERRLVLGR